MIYYDKGKNPSVESYRTFLLMKSDAGFGPSAKIMLLILLLPLFSMADMSHAIVSQW